MTKRHYILVANSGFASFGAGADAYRHPEKMAKKLLEEFLEDGESMLTLGDNAVFLETDQAIAPLTERVKGKLFPHDRLFFLADVTKSARAGNMPRAYWEALAASDVATIETRTPEQAA